ncbi:MAG: hypothetical protein QM755_12405 [Luteolibacter sp.]
MFLADHVLIETIADLRRGGDAKAGFLSAALALAGGTGRLALQNVRADLDALVADIDARTGNRIF